METLPLKPGVIYGPVQSRRLGASLGINLMPTDHKLCSFDCVYCHFGRTQVKSLQPDPSVLPNVEDVLTAVENELRAHSDLDYVTFSGNGEPTLHPEFPHLVAEVCRLRDRLLPQAKVAVLSNSTAVQLKPVRDSLQLLDQAIMKLDAGDLATLRRINRPAPGVELDQIIEGLKEIPNLMIQCVLIGGKVSNTSGAPFDAWLAALDQIRPAQVQIYSTDRPVPETYVERVPPDTLRRIADEVTERTSIPVDPYWQQA